MSEGSLIVRFVDGEECTFKVLEGSFRLCSSELSLNILKYDYGSIIEISVRSGGTDLDEYPVLMDLDLDEQAQGLLALTLLNLSGSFMNKAFNYYNYIAQGKMPKSEPPPERPEYPGDINYVGKWEHDSVNSWAFPMFPRDPGKIPPYTVFLLTKLGNSYRAYLALSSDQLTGFIGPGPKLVTFTGKPSQNIKGWPLVVGISRDPYEAVENAVKLASMVTPIKHRRSKVRPRFMNGLGWCSWNALLTEDLNHENIVRIVKGLRDRGGVPIRWVLIDDGWQELRNGILNSVKPDMSRFPKGFRALIDELKALGIEDVGLWFTVNMHWRGVTEDFLKSLGVEGYRVGEGYVPMPNLEGAFKLYDAWFRVLKVEGFGFVKVDNQWIIHRLYWGLCKRCRSL